MNDMTQMLHATPQQDVATLEGAQAVQHAMAAAHPAALQQALTLHALLGGWATRAVGNGVAAASLGPFAVDAQTWTELFQLQAAIIRRLHDQQQQNLQGWAGWLQERAQVRRANTMSKLVEQEFDLLARFVLLLSDQAVDLVTLQENVEVNTGYWLGQKAAAARVANPVVGTLPTESRD
ncbi:hypothetical protein [Cupriavidus necator]|uniref:hypothetical protein n=1 Tax=Cupriavidus necator TaxID=106590 RepID=UPI00339D8224